MSNGQTITNSHEYASRSTHILYALAKAICSSRDISRERQDVTTLIRNFPLVFLQLMYPIFVHKLTDTHIHTHTTNSIYGIGLSNSKCTDNHLLYILMSISESILVFRIVFTFIRNSSYMCEHVCVRVCEYGTVLRIQLRLPDKRTHIRRI